MIADHDYCTEGNMEEEEVLEPKAFLTSLTPYTNFTITVAAFTKYISLSFLKTCVRLFQKYGQKLLDYFEMQDIYWYHFDTFLLILNALAWK